jgi:hypothetical protein
MVTQALLEGAVSLTMVVAEIFSAQGGWEMSLTMTISPMARKLSAASQVENQILWPL